MTEMSCYCGLLLCTARGCGDCGWNYTNLVPTSNFASGQSTSQRPEGIASARPPLPLHIKPYSSPVCGVGQMSCSLCRQHEGGPGCGVCGLSNITRPLEHSEALAHDITTPGPCQAGACQSCGWWNCRMNMMWQSGLLLLSSKRPPFC